MKKFKDITEFENTLKGGLTNHSVPPPPDVWSAVSSGIAGNSASVISQVTNYFSSLTNILKVALFAGGISAIGVTLYTSNNSSATKNIKTPTTEITKSENELIEQYSSEEYPLNLTADSKKQEKNVDARIAKESTSAEVNQTDKNTPSTPLAQSDMPGGILEQQMENKPSTANTNQNADANITLALFASTNTPCLAQTITITNSRKEKGTWMENGKVILTNSSALNYKCKSVGVVNISFQNNEQIANTILKVQSVSTQIVTNKGLDENYTFSLSTPNQNANWYLDGLLLNSKTPQLQTKIINSGKHMIKAEILNSACPATLTKEITIKSKGKVEFYNIITPNGDGKNDSYVVNIENYDFFLIRIFDTKNNLVFESQNPDLQWNGNYQASGQICPNGEYIATLNYKLTGEDAKQKNIKITLIRD